MKINFELEKYKSLIISGPEGSEKTIAAQQIAKLNGSYAIINEHQAFWSLFGTGNFIPIDGVDTVIVDEIESIKKVIQQMRTLAYCKTIRVNRIGKPVVEIEKPNFIFCTSDKNAIKLCAKDHKFTIIKL